MVYYITSQPCFWWFRDSIKGLEAIVKVFFLCPYIDKGQQDFNQISNQMIKSSVKNTVWNIGNFKCF